MMKHATRLSLLLVVLLLLTACTGNDVPQLDGGAGADESGSTGEAVTITFGVQQFQRSQYEALVEQFNAANSDMQVQIIALDRLFDTAGGIDADQMLRQVAGAADTAVPLFLSPTALQKGYFQDLQPLMDADPNFDQDDFFPAALAGYRVDGGTYLLPYSVQVTLLNYNKDLWQAANLPEPAADWDWSDMIGAAEALTRQRGNTIDVYGLLELDGIATFIEELKAAGVDVLATPADDLQLDDPAVVEALERTQNLVESGAVYASVAESGVRQFDSNDMQALVSEQRVGMWLSNTVGDFAGELDFEIGRAALPADSLFALSNAQGYVMSSGTQHPELAWRWLEFLSRQSLPENQLIMNGSSSQLPARKSLVEAAGHWENMDADMAAAVRASLERENITLPTGLFEQPSPFEAINSALEAVLTDAATPQQALIEAQQAFDEQLAAAQSTPEAVDEGPIVVATPAAEQAPSGATRIAYFPHIVVAERELQDLREAFHAQHPEIFVDIYRATAEDPMSVAHYAANTDCFSWHSRMTNDELEHARDLQPLYDADANLANDAYPAALLTPFRYEGGLYGLPHAVGLQTLNYNQTAFEEAGLEPPDADWTTDDFLFAAQQLDNGAEGANRRYGYASVHLPIQELNFFLNQFEARPVQGSLEEPELHYTDPAVIQGAQYYIDLLQNYSPHDSLYGYQRDFAFDSEPYQLLDQGRVGMWFAAGFAAISIAPDAGFTVAVAPPPMGEAALSVDQFDISGHYISADSEHPEACWQWLMFLSEQPAAINGFSFPARISTAESPDFLENTQTGVAEVYAAYRERFDRMATSADERMALALFAGNVDPFWFYRAVDRALQGADLERELQAAEDLTRRYLDCVQVEEDAAGCATSVDPEYDGFNNK
jgi:ABC-type glycerol-3-phosphate transport system substrate-binding protein